MTDSFLDKYVSRQAVPTAEPVPDEPEAMDNYHCFGYLRGARDRALMLQLRKRNGNVLALGYAWLEKAEFDPSEAITLHFVGRKVRILGRNLNAEVRPTIRLFDAITRHRVSWIAEADGEIRLLNSKEELVVLSIELL